MLLNACNRLCCWRGEEDTEKGEQLSSISSIRVLLLLLFGGVGGLGAKKLAEK